MKLVLLTLPGLTKPVFLAFVLFMITGLLTKPVRADTPEAAQATTGCAVPDIPDTEQNREALAAGFVEEVPTVPVFLEPAMAATLQRIAPIDRPDFESAAGFFIRYTYIDQIVFEGLAQNFTTEEIYLLTRLLSDPSGRSALRKLDKLRHQSFKPIQNEIYRAVQEAQKKSRELQYKKKMLGLDDDDDDY